MDWRNHHMFSTIFCTNSQSNQVWKMQPPALVKSPAIRHELISSRGIVSSCSEREIFFLPGSHEPLSFFYNLECTSQTTSHMVPCTCSKLLTTKYTFSTSLKIFINIIISIFLEYWNEMKNMVVEEIPPSITGVSSSGFSWDPTYMDLVIWAWVCQVCREVALKLLPVLYINSRWQLWALHCR